MTRRPALPPGPALPPRPVLKYYLFMATTSAGLVVPIWVVFLRAQDLGYTEILVLDAVWWVGIVVGEVPTGLVGDRFGWRNSLVGGNLLRAAAVVGMGLSATFEALAGVYLLWALGSTLQSGSRDAWLYELLAERLDEAAFTRVQGRGRAVSLAASAVGAVAGGYVGAVDLQLPFLATGAAWVLGAGVLLTFPAVAVAPDDRPTTREALPVLRDHLTRRPVLSVVLWVAVVLAAAAGVARLTQPVSRGLGVPVPGLGWLYAGFALLAAVASDRAATLRRWFGLEGWLLVAPLVLAVLLAGSALAPLVALPGFVVLRAVRAATRPMAGQYVNDRVGTVGRATVLSGVSLVYSLVKIPAAVAVGVLADARTPLAAVAAAGVALAVATVAAWLVRGSLSVAETAARPAD